MSLTAGQRSRSRVDGSTVTAKARSETVAAGTLHITPVPEMVAVDRRGQRRATIASELVPLRPGGVVRHHETVRWLSSLPKGTRRWSRRR